MRKHRMSDRSIQAPLRLAIVVAVVLIVADALLGWLLASVAPHIISGTAYVLGVIMIAASWGLGLAIMTRLAGGSEYRKMHFNTYGGWLPANPVDLVLHAAEARRAAD
jgi:heme A synthase